MVCFLGLLHWRKSITKTVMPGCPRESQSEPREGGSGSSPAQSSGHTVKRESDEWDSERRWGRPFPGIRSVQSANAVLFTLPFGASLKESATLQTETEAQFGGTEKRIETKQETQSETEAEIENPTTTHDVGATPASPHEDLHCVVVNTDTLPYLSIGINQNEPDHFNGQSTGGQGQRSQMGKAIGRISTWPPTAIQWQARRKQIEEEEEEGSDVFTVWTPEFPSEVKKVRFGPHCDDKEEETEKNLIDDPEKINVTKKHAGRSETPKPSDLTVPVGEALSQAHMEQQKEEMIQNPRTVRQTTTETGNLNVRELGATATRAEQRNERKPAGASRQKEHRRDRSTAGSKTPSGGASPDDETLLSGNEYAFMDLLHEVVQNNGRWTRERWRQTHGNKQRCSDRAVETHSK